MKRKGLFVLQAVAAIILLQTLRYKFSGDPLSVHIFSTLGVEPWGRYLAGISELVAGIFLLLPRTAWVGALIGSGVMAGAILSHLLFLGINVQGDGGALFGMACLVFACCAAVLYIRRDEIKLKL